MTTLTIGEINAMLARLHERVESLEEKPDGS